MNTLILLINIGLMAQSKCEKNSIKKSMRTVVQLKRNFFSLVRGNI